METEEQYREYIKQLEAIERKDLIERDCYYDTQSDD